MFLNDAFDADFDRQRRLAARFRPAPLPADGLAAGVSACWRRGAIVAGRSRQNRRRAALVLLVCIIVYDADAQGHHRVAVADGLVPVLGLCHRRFDGRHGV